MQCSGLSVRNWSVENWQQWTSNWGRTSPTISQHTPRFPAYCTPLQFTVHGSAAFLFPLWQSRDKKPLWFALILILADTFCYKNLYETTVQLYWQWCTHDIGNHFACFVLNFRLDNVRLLDIHFYVNWGWQFITPRTILARNIYPALHLHI